ncbi:MAG: Uncharacterized protein FD123_4137 [Bacteroidetes bacterium]|nr:MAG: Uncharacterized protein FD123_4137 [Bacteroidota bacterium]
MKTEQELNTNILHITMIIQDRYPELSKYLEEMPVTIPDEVLPEISPKTLKTYYDTLRSMLHKYISASRGRT